MTPAEPLTQLGRYQLKRVIGRGAMGLVYEGLDPRLERTVAVKTILKGHLLDEMMAADYSARFVREAQAAARLNHPNIVTVFDFGEQDQVAYLVMEFIRGRELAAHFDDDDFFDLPQALRIMGELLDALAYAHERGIVHRDVKPANVMIDTTGRVKLTDFGVARLADSNAERTLPGTMVGTPSYMSPEQIQGLAVGSRTDLFAAGVVLYQFLTRHKPFTGGGQWTIQKKIVHDDPLPPTLANHALPPVFDSIVQRALAKDPEQRYPNAAEFAADLRRALAALPPMPPATALPQPDPDATVVLPLRGTAAPAPVSVALPSTAPPYAAAAAATATALARAPSRWAWGIGAALLAGLIGGSAWRLATHGSGAPLSAGTAAPPAVHTPPDATAVPLPAPLPVPQPAAVRADQPAAAAPALAGPAAMPPPVRATAPKPAARPLTARPASPANAHCGELQQRMQLGEPLSAESLTFFQKECRR